MEGINAESGVLLMSCRIEVENPLKACEPGLWRICNVKPEQMENMGMLPGAAQGVT